MYVCIEQYKRFLVYVRFTNRHLFQFININDLYLHLHLQRKKGQIKKPEFLCKVHKYSGCFIFFSNPNVQNGTSWCLTTLSKKLNLVRLETFSNPNVENGTNWSLTTFVKIEFCQT